MHRTSGIAVKRVEYINRASIHAHLAIAESDKEIKTALTEIAGLQKQLKVTKAD